MTMKPLQYFEAPQENLTVFTCLIDMIALEEGVFGSGTSTSRIARAHRNLQYGLKLKDGSIFRYTHAKGPSLQDDNDKIIILNDGTGTGTVLIKDIKKSF